MKPTPLPQRIAPVLAALSFITALAASSALSPGLSHLATPMALPGARGAPLAWLFNALAFVLPGALLAWRALAARGALHGARWPPRIGLQLALLSALAFAAQGLLAIDPRDLDAQASRLHALAWSLCWLAFVPGALLLAWSRQGGALVGSVALLATLCAFAGPALLGAPLAQRVAWLLWLAWWVAAFSRGAASAPGSSRPARR